MRSLVDRLAEYLKQKTSFKIQYVMKHYTKKKNMKVLDVGCGNESPYMFKTIFPEIEYYGIDKELYNLSEKSLKYLDEKHFLLCDLEKELDRVKETFPDNFFDFVVFSHVIEHLENGLEALDIISRKVKSGGGIYIEYPTAESVNFPSMKGTLNFCDDITHKRLYSKVEICNILIKNGFIIKKAKIKRSYFKILLIPMGILYYTIIVKKPIAGLFWDLFGFAEYIYAIKR